MACMKEMVVIDHKHDVEQYIKFPIPLSANLATIHTSAYKLDFSQKFNGEIR